MGQDKWKYECSAVELASGRFVGRLVISAADNPGRQQARGFAKQFDSEAEAIAYADGHAALLRARFARAEGKIMDVQ